MTDLSISSISSTPPASASLTAQKLSAARAADGDYKASGKGHAVKDADGDYKPSTAPGSAATTSSSGVLAALTSLKKGG
ncbi:hypothetical protein [Lichenifustis flavocetrariae]|uniref:Uncharacterized protein n=1 Tax=Lichenifustis flavocetrariae TaxID=2949735 RepID=A0AA42CMS1_9HYPH|nr:hypothetical protein [Lichenifustis flavocetrariae]MCW6512813.1 hypothetical protein [Lichenifustis flavocetrariae]